MARTNYSFEKRQRELAKKKKKEEKRQQKALAREAKAGKPDDPIDGAETEAGSDNSDQSTAPEGSCGEEPKGA